MNKLLDTIVKAALDWLLSVWQRERAKQNEYLAKALQGQLESMKKSGEMEGRINDITPPCISPTVPPSPSQWNESARIECGNCGVSMRVSGALIFLLVLLPGCFTRTVFIESRLPYIDKPARPVLPEEPPEWTSREMLLIEYATALEGRVRAYNVEARTHNRANGYEN